MKVDTMRKIDRGVGIPLCFLISPVCWLADWFRSARKRDPDVRRTLFIELSEMGSAVIADPAMRKLQLEGQAELYFVIFKDNAKSLNILNTITASNIFSMKANNLFVLVMEIFRFIKWCRQKKITAVIDLELFSRFTALLAFFSGARSRIGFYNFHDEGLYRGNLINKPVRYNPHVHVAINFISLVNTALGLHQNPYPTTPVLPEALKLAKATVHEEDLTVVRKKISNVYPDWNGEALVLFNVNASDMLPQRRWPPENFVAVGKSLLRHFQNILIVATGAPADIEFVEQMVDVVYYQRCINSSGLFSFNELISLYTLSTCMLTNDSGPAHFASVTPLKVFVLFGPETPVLYLPLGNAEPFYLGLPCSPCVSAANHRKTSCTTRPCITGIQPQWVTERMKVYLTEQLFPEQIGFAIDHSSS